MGFWPINMNFSGPSVGLGAALALSGVQELDPGWGFWGGGAKPSACASMKSD